MVSSSTSRSSFIQSAIAFMRTYAFDGIDMDWEYPAATDRDGVAADTANFVTFLKELRQACGSTYGISATLPSSYWYLQGFDIAGMQDYLDFFNLMCECPVSDSISPVTLTSSAYDIHGTWDGNNAYVLHNFGKIYWTHTTQVHEQSRATTYQLDRDRRCSGSIVAKRHRLFQGESRSRLLWSFFYLGRSLVQQAGMRFYWWCESWRMHSHLWNPFKRRDTTYHC